jgi:hypothetical protein
LYALKEFVGKNLGNIVTQFCHHNLPRSLWQNDTSSIISISAVPAKEAKVSRVALLPHHWFCQHTLIMEMQLKIQGSVSQENLIFLLAVGEMASGQNVVAPIPIRNKFSCCRATVTIG